MDRASRICFVERFLDSEMGVPVVGNPLFGFAVDNASSAELRSIKDTALTYRDDMLSIVEGIAIIAE